MIEDIAREEKYDSESNLVLRHNGFHFFKMKTKPHNCLMAHLHMHDAIEFIYMNEGSVRVSSDDKEFSLLPGDLTLFRSRGIHCIYSENQDVNNYYVLKISMQYLASILPSNLFKKILLRFISLNLDFKTVWRRDEIENSEIFSALCNLKRELDEPSFATELTQISSILTILHEICKDTDFNLNTKTVGSDTIYKAIVYVNDKFDSEISAEDVAKKFGMSLGYFSRSFKATTGKSFREYLIEIRLNKAEQLLINSNATITDVSMQCGYPNVSHFIALYKKYKGTTPLKSRKNKI